MNDMEMNVTRDIVQSRVLGAIFSNSVKNEIALKGGFAMRVMANSQRFTKDIDLAASPSLPLRAVQQCIRKSLTDLKGIGLVEDMKVTEPKQTETTQRWKIGGRVGDHEINLTIEISRRDELANDIVKTEYQTPASGIGPVPIACIGLPSLAAAKMDCLSNPNREAPRDIYDLYLLIKMDVRPTKELIAQFGEEKLAEIREMIWHKMDKMNYSVASERLLSFLPAEAASKITRDVWQEMRLVVGEELTKWANGDVGGAPPSAREQKNESVAQPGL